MFPSLMNSMYSLVMSEWYTKILSRLRLSAVIRLELQISLFLL